MTIPKSKNPLPAPQNQQDQEGLAPGERLPRFWESLGYVPYMMPPYPHEKSADDWEDIPPSARSAGQNILAAERDGMALARATLPSCFLEEVNNVPGARELQPVAVRWLYVVPVNVPLDPVEDGSELGSEVWGVLKTIITEGFESLSYVGAENKTAWQVGAITGSLVEGAALPYGTLWEIGGKIQARGAGTKGGLGEGTILAYALAIPAYYNTSLLIEEDNMGAPIVKVMGEAFLMGELPELGDPFTTLYDGPDIRALLFGRTLMAVLIREPHIKVNRIGQSQEC